MRNFTQQHYLELDTTEKLCGVVRDTRYRRMILVMRCHSPNASAFLRILQRESTARGGEYCEFFCVCRQEVAETITIKGDFALLGGAAGVGNLHHFCRSTLAEADLVTWRAVARALHRSAFGLRSR